MLLVFKKGNRLTVYLLDKHGGFNLVLEFLVYQNSRGQVSV